MFNVYILNIRPNVRLVLFSLEKYRCSQENESYLDFTILYASVVSVLKTANNVCVYKMLVRFKYT